MFIMYKLIYKKMMLYFGIFWDRKNLFLKGEKCAIKIKIKNINYIYIDCLYDIYIWNN